MFETLQQVPNHDESKEDQLTQILIDIQEGSDNNNEVESEQEENKKEESKDDSRGIDLMASDDDDDEEEIEPENNEDRAFLNDQTEEQEDASFYRRLNVELDTERRQERRKQQEELAEHKDVLFREMETSNNKVLTKLAEKLNAYLQELLVLGFNSGKCDFSFPTSLRLNPSSSPSRPNSPSSWIFLTISLLDLAMTSSLKLTSVTRTKVSSPTNGLTGWTS